MYEAIVEWGASLENNKTILYILCIHVVLSWEGWGATPVPPSLKGNLIRDRHVSVIQRTFLDIKQVITHSGGGSIIRLVVELRRSHYIKKVGHIAKGQGMVWLFPLCLCLAGRDQKP